jgi:hypothetical protein
MTAWCWCKGEKCSASWRHPFETFLSRVPLPAAPGRYEVSLLRKRAYVFTNNDAQGPTLSYEALVASAVRCLLRTQHPRRQRASTPRAPGHPRPRLWRTAAYSRYGLIDSLT